MKKVEMHCHILPGIDDGAEDMKQSLQMLHIAMEHEIVGAIVTPHGSARDASRERTEKIRKLCRIFRAKAEQQFDVIFPVFPGQEILYSSDTRRLLDEGKLLTLADTRYVLVEFMPEVPYSTLFAAVRELRLAGYVPILAHVERYHVLREDGRIEELIHAGAKIQINYSSVGGSWHSKTTRWCRKQLEEQNVHFLSTDMHDPLHRSPDTEAAEKWMQKHLEPEYIRMMVHGSAREILEEKRRKKLKSDKGTR